MTPEEWRSITLKRKLVWISRRPWGHQGINKKKYQVGKRLTMGMLKKYIRIFTMFWNCYLDDDEEMQVHIYVKANMIAIEFFPVDKGDLWDLTIKKDWKYVLDRLPESIVTLMGTSKIVSSDGVIVIKPPDKRSWSPGQAMEDAEATLCEAMIKGLSI